LPTWPNAQTSGARPFGGSTIAEDGIYDPSHFNDRLLLGLKGTMSEAELHMLRARMRGGLLNKARRGQLRCRLPIGFVYDQQRPRRAGRC
jgi:DNA invertase Pin-like site-specific DNA recombinase